MKTTVSLLQKSHKKASEQLQFFYLKYRKKMRLLTKKNEKKHMQLLREQPHFFYPTGPTLAQLQGARCNTTKGSWRGDTVTRLLWWGGCLFIESTKAKLAPGKENVDSQVNPTAVLVRPGRVDSAQKNTILDQGLNTGFFGLP